MRRTKPAGTKKEEKGAAVRSVVLNAVFQLIGAGILLYLRSLTQLGWLRGLALILAAIDLVTIPFSLVSLGQRLREIEKGDLDEARKY